MPDKTLVIAQFSDSHLFADVNGLHYGANVYQNLLRVLNAIAQDTSVDIIVFTGDLTQDHSEQSHLNFVNAVKLANIRKPIYFLAGNHDEYAMLNHYLNEPPFCQDKIIEHNTWQIFLLNTKSDTPAGFASSKNLAQLNDHINLKKQQLIFTHHHPINVNFFIDKHGLTNKPEFWRILALYPSIKAVACGHVHRALSLSQRINDRVIQVFTCPATSIQFDPQAEEVKALINEEDQGVGYRRLQLHSNGEISTQVIQC